jgi:hypothetical protein
VIITAGPPAPQLCCSQPRIGFSARTAALGRRTRPRAACYLTEHGERLAAIVPAGVAAELASLDDDECAELIEEILAAAAGRRGLESIAAGEPVVPWEDVKARLGL